MSLVNGLNCSTICGLILTLFVIVSGVCVMFYPSPKCYHIYGKELYHLEHSRKRAIEFARKWKATLTVERKNGVEKEIANFSN